jgi:hypothetical protein
VADRAQDHLAFAESVMRSLATGGG